MPEIVGRFAGCEGRCEAADAAAQAGNCVLGSLAQTGLELAERHLDRIEVGGVFGQIAKRRAACFDRLANSGSLVGREIVDHDGILGSERRGKTPFDIGQELLSGHGAVDGLRRSHATPAQRDHESDGLPVVLRHMPNQPLAAGATAAQPYHLGVGGCLVDEHQPGRVKHALFSHPPPPLRATSARSCSAARSAFFERDLVALKEPSYRGATAGDLVSAHHGNHLVQRQVRLLVEDSQQKLRVFLQRRGAPAAPLGGAPAGLAKHLTQITAVLGLTVRLPPAAKRRLPPEQSHASSCPQNKTSASSRLPKANQCRYNRLSIPPSESLRFNLAGTWSSELHRELSRAGTLEESMTDPEPEATLVESHEDVQIEQSDSPFEEGAENLDFTSGLEAAGLTVNDVRWNPKDEDQPDYSHLDKSFVGEKFEFNGDDLARLVLLNSFMLAKVGNAVKPVVIFALRGAKLVDGDMQINKRSLTIADHRPDHRDFRCVIGVWNRSDNTLSAFRASTVPNAPFVFKCYWMAQTHGTVIGNVLPTGCYTYTVGVHHRNKPGEIKGALRLGQTEDGASTVVVLRSLTDVIYDRNDLWDPCAPADNIHPAQLAVSFSSAGCMTIPGTARGAVHRGPWAKFRETLGLNNAAYTDAGTQFSCVLLTGLDAAIAAGVREQGIPDDDPAVASELRRIRFGSQGPDVARLQARLGIAPDRAQMVGATTRKALVVAQEKALGWADGILSPAMDAALGTGVFPRV